MIRNNHLLHGIIIIIITITRGGTVSPDAEWRNQTTSIRCSRSILVSEKEITAR
jgi:hypothetical protein